MSNWDQARDSYNEVYAPRSEQHEGKLSHELLAGAAAFAGLHEFEEHQRKQGKEVKHEFAKELLAGFAGAEADKLFETKGRDAYDNWSNKEEAKRDATEQAVRYSDNLYQQHYGNQENYDPNYPHHEHLEGEKHHRHHHRRDEDDE